MIANAATQHHNTTVELVARMTSDALDSSSQAVDTASRPAQHLAALLHLHRVLQVTDWLDYILGKCDLPPSFMRRQEPPERKRKKKPGEPAAKPNTLIHQHQHQPPYVPGRAGSAGRPPQVMLWTVPV